MLCKCKKEVLKWDYLDFGFVELEDFMGDEDVILKGAYVCTQKNIEEKTDEEKQATLKYIIRNNHNTPLEHIKIRLRLKLPKFVMIQLGRYRSQVYNELSQRYNNIAKNDLYIPNEIKGISDKKKIEEIQNIIRHSYSSSISAYKVLLSEGMKKEQARIVVPMGIYTEIIQTIDLRSLLHVIDERLNTHAQYEIQELAKIFKEIVKKIVPKFSELYFGLENEI